MLGLILYAHNAKLIVHPGSIRKTIIKSSITPAVFGVSILIAFWNPQLATMTWWLVAVAFFVVDPMINNHWERLSPKRARKG